VRLVRHLAPLAGTALFAGSLGAGFTHDDVQSILGHGGVHGPFSFGKIFGSDFWGLPFDRTIGTWRPLATLTCFVDWHLSGGKPWSFHLTNLICFAALLYAADMLLGRWCEGALGDRARAICVFVFAALAIHADVVPSATGRAEILAALFVLLSLAALVRPGRPLGGSSVALGAAAMALALLSKESSLPMVLAVPLVATSCHARRGTLKRRGLVLLWAALSTVGIAYVALRAGRLPFAKVTPAMLADNPLGALPLLRQKIGALEVMSHYLEHTLTGLDLVCDYSYSAIAIATRGVPVRALLGGLFLLGLAALAVASWRKRPQIAEAIVGFAGAYAVASHLLVPASAIVADRLFFLPSFWLVATGALGAAWVAREQRVGRMIGLCAVAFGVAQGAVAAAATTSWHDDAVLYTQAVQSRPHVARTRLNLARALADAGRSEDAAWHALLATAYLTRFPDPIGDDEFPLSWDDLPIRERLERLRRTLGEGVMRALLAKTAQVLRDEGRRAAAEELTGWLRVRSGP
jgi:hypothetical protein